MTGSRDSVQERPDRAGSDRMPQKIAALVYREVRGSSSPRRVPWLGLIVSAYTERSALLVAGLTAMGLVAIAYALVLPMREPGRLVAVLAAALVTLWFLALPLLNARHYATIVRHGVVSSGVVRSVTYLGPREVLGKTVEAMRNGVAFGELEVEGSMAALHFETDEPWARELRPGARLMAVTDLGRQRVLLLVRQD